MILKIDQTERKNEPTNERIKRANKIRRNSQQHITNENKALTLTETYKYWNRTTVKKAYLRQILAL